MSPDALAALRALISDPQLAESISPEQAATYLANLVAAQWALVSRLQTQVAPAVKALVPNEPDCLLTPTETADRLGVTVRWLYRHAAQLPFTRRLSRKVLRFSEAGLARYLEGRRR